MLKFVPMGMLLTGILMIVYGMFGDAITVDGETAAVVGALLMSFGVMLYAVKSGYWS